MADETIIVIDKIEEAEDNKGKRYLKITDKAGVTRNFKEGRSNLLTNKEHLLEEGKAITLHFQDYKAPDGKVFPFVKDFELVKDEFVAQATKKVQAQAKDSREDSIEAQVAQKGGIEVLKVLIEQALLTDVEIQQCRDYAMSSISWGMERINLPSIIVSKIEEAKIETTKAQTLKTTDTGEQAPVGDTVLADETKPETVPEFLSWLASHNIKSPRTWLLQEWEVPTNKALTVEYCQKLWADIKEGKGW